MNNILINLNQYDKTALDVLSGFLVSCGLNVEVWQEQRALLLKDVGSAERQVVENLFDVYKLNTQSKLNKHKLACWLHYNGLCKAKSINNSLTRSINCIE